MKLTETLTAGAHPSPLSGTRIGSTVARRETIVLVEDDKPLRQVIRVALERSGYPVLAAASEAEALALMESNHVDLLLTDVMLDSGDGYEFARLVTETRKNLRVLFISGHANDSRLVNAAGIRHPNFLPKPFTASKLVNKVREVLDALPPPN